MPEPQPGPSRASRAWLIIVVIAALTALGVWVIGPAFAEQPPRQPAYGAMDAEAPTTALPDVADSAPEDVQEGRSSAPGGNAALVDAAWAERAATATRIPVRALLAYAGAELAMAAEQPGCRLGWTTLAALGAIESAHGTHAGAEIGRDGVTRPGVWGPDLNGVGTALIRDTDGGAIDGTAAADRAVGPLQFIPATWQQWGADGNGDGVSDPQQIDDAALAAARYLCHHGDLSVAANWRTAIFAYNHLDSYVNDVAATANVYAERAR